MNSQHGNKQKYESQNPIQRALIARFQAEMVSLVRRCDPSTIIDVGCGEGYTLACLREAGIGAKFEGIDLSQKAIDEARRRLGSEVLLHVEDARDLAARGCQYDLVVMTEVLEHIAPPGPVLEMLNSLTSRYVLLSVPWEPYFCSLNFLRGKNLRAWGNDPEHVNHWGRKAFRRFVEEKFQIIASPGVFPWTMVLAKKR